MKVNMKLAAYTSLLLALTFMLSEAETSSIQLKPRSSETFAVNYIQNLGNCSYMVVVKTSCDSRNYTRDQISIAFGDAYGNQVYAPRLDDPFTNTFKNCSSDAFQIDGPCTKDICYAYFHRIGPDGWDPESVKIFAPDSSPVAYNFNTTVPNGVWHGVNLCQPFPTEPPPPSFEFPPPPPPPSFEFPPPPPPSSSNQHRVPRWFVYLILGFVISAQF